jgi:hypothetical protein
VTCRGATEAKAVVRDGSDDQVREREDRRRLETVVVPAVNDANGVAGDTCGPGETECMGSGDSTGASRKLKEIDGRTPQGVECAG